MANLLIWYLMGATGGLRDESINIRAAAEKLGETFDNLDVDFNNAMFSLASARVSDSRWPPLPQSPGRFNGVAVTKKLPRMRELKNCLKEACLFQ